ncbi:MAG: hypothetical protein GY790_09940 [Bacteroidetes bacterium]|nr:hypothetical protein [Bacteroidota bacterium]
MKTSNRVLAAILIHLVFGGTAWTQDFINITNPVAPPEWALLQREVLKANSQAVVEFSKTYLDEKGYLLHVPRWGMLDGADDAMECFRRWPMLHMLGAKDTVLSLYKFGHEGHLQQYTAVTTDCTDVARVGCYYKEFNPHADWKHQGEGMQGFIYQGLSDPTDITMQQRYRRFAGFYLNEDPDALNYDPEHRIIRSFWNGSMGPLLRDGNVYDWAGDPTEGRFHMLYNLGGKTRMMRYEEEYAGIVHHFYYFPQSTRGDHPFNLVTTQLAMNAYMLEHEDKYRDWLIEYASAWIQRAADNGGNFPSNVGLDGKIGDILDGKWYRGTYGWNFSYFNWRKSIHHENRIFLGLWPGMANGLMVTGDQLYIEAARRQMDNLFEHKKTIHGREMIPRSFGMHIDRDKPQKQNVFEIKDSMLYIPEGMGVEGWYNWKPLDGSLVSRLVDLYLWSNDPQDKEKIEDHSWIQFLEGDNPAYPEQALRSDLLRIRNQVRDMRNDYTTPDTRLAFWPLEFDPATIHNLVNLMMGGNLGGMIWNLHCRVRYFDPENRRAGIPEDVAGLVTGIDGEITRLSLVNINQIEARTVILQTGAYGEHQCEWVKVNGEEYRVDSRSFTVRLAPGAGAELEINAERYVNQPTLAFPWHGETVPRSY